MEVRERPRPTTDDERRRYYRITPFGTAVARAEARRLAGAGEAGPRGRLRPGQGLMRAYRALLRLFPASFRREYGDEMAARLRAAPARGVRGRWPRGRLAGGGRATCWPTPLRVHLDLLRQDLRYTARTLGRAPGFTATAVAVAALGVGATTAAFSIADHVLIRPLPFADPGAPGDALAGPAFPRLLAQRGSRRPTTATGRRIEHQLRGHGRLPRPDREPGGRGRPRAARGRVR